MHNDSRLLVLTAALVLAASTTACQGKALPDTATDAATDAAGDTAQPAATATQEQKDPAVRQYSDLTKMQLTDDRCHWLDATTRVALNATAAERLAWLNDQSPRLQPDAAALAAAKAHAEAARCDEGNRNPDTLAVRYGAWQMRATWALRAQALLDGGQRPAWFTQQSPVLPYRKALDETIAALNAKFGESIALGQPAIEQEAEQMLALACPNKPNACPSDKPAAKVGKDYAQAWVMQAAIFAEALAKDPVKLTPVPEPES